MYSINPKNEGKEPETTNKQMELKEVTNRK